eukprot:961149-Pelagomonas_calceolata.AAC.1
MCARAHRRMYLQVPVFKWFWEKEKKRKDWASQRGRVSCLQGVLSTALCFDGVVLSTLTGVKIRAQVFLPPKLIPGE